MKFKTGNLLPRDTRERTMCIILAFLIILLPLWGAFFVLPYYHAILSSISFLHLISWIYISFNIFFNLYHVLRVDASGKQSLLPSILMPGWNYCHVCQLNSPPRSYHCYECNECILKRDHHCGFVGGCVGYHNHRYYLVGITYLLIGGFYGAIYQWKYTFDTMGGYSFGSFLTLVMPHFALLLGYLHWTSFLVPLTQIIWFVVCVLSSYLWYMQIKSIYHGQTQYERRNDIRVYDLGWRRNFQDVLGSRWLLTWFNPFVVSPLSGDGLKFIEARNFEEVKNM